MTISEVQPAIHLLGFTRKTYAQSPKMLEGVGLSGFMTKLLRYGMVWVRMPDPQDSIWPICPTKNGLLIFFSILIQSMSVSRGICKSKKSVSIFPNSRLSIFCNLRQLVNLYFMKGNKGKRKGFLRKTREELLRLEIQKVQKKQRNKHLKLEYEQKIFHKS